MNGRPQHPVNGIPIAVPSLGTIPVWLRHFPISAGAQPRGVVVLLHGGNSSGDVFLTPRGGAVAVLQSAGWDTWVLEYRASPYVVEDVLRHPALGGSAISECRRYTFDQIVAEDIPNALAYVRANTPRGARLAVVGHCLGAGMTALACARGQLEPYDVDTLVLCELGLFVEVPWNGWVKPEDFILERVLHDSPEQRAIDPRHPESWPPTFADAAQAWPKAWLPAKGTTRWQHLLYYLSFMVGQPYSQSRLDPSFRNDSVESFFGPMHLGLYLHAAQSVRRGYMARFDTLDVLDRPRIVPVSDPPTPAASRPPADDLDPTHFRGKNVTLIAAGQSHLWHRDAIDLMYDWLRNIKTAPGIRHQKRVFESYNLQELFWAETAGEVYEAIRDSL